MTQNRTGPIARALALSLAACFWAVGTSARSESLVDAWAIALQANAQLQSQNLNTAASDRNLAAARQAWIPTVRTFNFDAQVNTTPKIAVQTVNGPIPSTGAGTTPGGGGASPIPSLVPIPGFHQTNLPISLTSASMPVYTGGRIRNNIRSADAQRNAQRSQEFRTALDLKLTVAEAYIAILRARRNLEVAESDVARLESFARDIRNRKAQGLATRNDELSAEVSLANARLGLIRQRNALEVAWATYNRYLCRPPETVVPLEELGSDTEHDPAVGSDPGRLRSPATGGGPGPGPVPIPPGEAEVRQLTAMALGGRPELVGLTEQARSLGALAEATRAEVRPQASIGGGFLFFGQQNWIPQGYGLAAFMVDWTIVDAPTRRKAEALKLQETSALKRRDDAAQDIMLQVRTRWLDLQTARQSVGVARTAVAQAEENVNVVLDRYRQQLSNNTDVLNAESRRVQSLSNYYNALYDVALADVRLRRAVGDL